MPEHQPSAASAPRSPRAFVSRARSAFADRLRAPRRAHPVAAIAAAIAIAITAAPAPAASAPTPTLVPALAPALPAPALAAPAVPPAPATALPRPSSAPATGLPTMPLLTITLLVDLPPTTPAAAPVYIAGDFQNWNPADPACRLHPTRTDHRYRIDLDLPAATTTLVFKFTRGSWDSVEKGAGGREIPNRTLTVTPGATYNLRVAAWATPLSAPADAGADAAAPVEHTFSGTVLRLDLPAPAPTDPTDPAAPVAPNTTPVPTAAATRPLWVYLPPDYATPPAATHRYPVLYLLDGQNVFDRATSFAGEWQADETCETLIAAAAIEPLIVVAVANGGPARSLEYTPWPAAPPAAEMPGGAADAHLQWLADTVIPYIDTHFRTRAGAADRALAGSSLGGLFSLYAALKHPTLFGRAGVFSPSLGWNPEQLFPFLLQSSRRFNPAAPTAPVPPRPRLYLDMGGLEPGYFEDRNHNRTADCIDDLRAVAALLETRGGWRRDADLFLVEDPAARHTESAWAARFPGFLRRIFPPPAGDRPGLPASP